MFRFKKPKFPSLFKKKTLESLPAAQDAQKQKAAQDAQEQKPENKDVLDIFQRIAELQKIRLSRPLMNKIGIVLGFGVAAAGIAADMTFLGGVGTVTVATCLVADFRNAQQIKKVSREIEKLDDKLDDLRREMREEPALAPAITLLRKTVSDFEAAAVRENRSVQGDLAALRLQVDALVEKLGADAQNDNAGAAPDVVKENAPAAMPQARNTKKKFWGF